MPESEPKLVSFSYDIALSWHCPKAFGDFELQTTHGLTVNGEAYSLDLYIYSRHMIHNEDCQIIYENKWIAHFGVINEITWDKVGLI